MNRVLVLLLMMIGVMALIARTRAENFSPTELALVGRWQGRNELKQGDFVGYNCIVFTSNGHFAFFAKSFNAKTEQWSNADKVFHDLKNAGMFASFLGSYQVVPPKSLLLKANILLSEMPMELEYELAGDTLTLRAPKDGLPWMSSVCKRTDRFEFEPVEPQGADQKSLMAQVDEALSSQGHSYQYDAQAGHWREHPTDDALIKNFREHRKEFETLLEMIRHDKGLEAVWPDSVRPEDPSKVGVSAERLGEYRRLFRVLGLENGVANFREDQTIIEFKASSVGMFNRGSAKGYYWLAGAPPVGDSSFVVEDLDVFEAKRKEERKKSVEKTGRGDGSHTTAYRLIEEHWYLYYDD